MVLRFILLGIVIVVAWVNILPHLVPKRPREPMDDAGLRQMALSRGMRPVPTKGEELLKLLDTPQNPLTRKKVALGKTLFFDPALSKDATLSCATCHMLQKEPKNQKRFLYDLTHKETKTDCMVCHIKDQSGTDRLSCAVGMGSKPDPLHKNTLSVLNSALAKYQLWDATSPTLLQTTKQMLLNPARLGISKELLERRLRQNSRYVTLFQETFGTSPNFQDTLRALEAYQKTLLTRSAFDRFLEGDDDALSAEAKRGLRDFIELGCKGCHTGMSIGGQTYVKFPARNYNYIINVTGVFSTEYLGRDVARFDFNFKPYHRFPFENRGGFLGRNDQQFFRVPILRNVTKTSPYFHNGAVFDLRKAVYIMGKYQLGMELSETQIDEITAFLGSLEGDVVEYKDLP